VRDYPSNRVWPSTSTVLVNNQARWDGIKADQGVGGGYGTHPDSLAERFILKRRYRSMNFQGGSGKLGSASSTALWPPGNTNGHVGHLGLDLRGAMCDLLGSYAVRR
jgi:hypothetical protein